MDTSEVDVVYVERLADGGEREHAGPEAILALTSGGQRRKIRGRFRVRNRTGQALWVVLAYFSDAYGVYILSNESVPAGDAWTTIWGDGPTDTLDLEDGVDQSVERFKLVVATEKVDDFLLAQPALTPGDEYGATRAVEASSRRARSRTPTNGSPGTSPSGGATRATRHRARISRRCHSAGTTPSSSASTPTRRCRR